MHIATGIAQRIRAGMREYDWRMRCLDGIFHRSHANVGQVNQHSKTIHLFDNSLRDQNRNQIRIRVFNIQRSSVKGHSPFQSRLVLRVSHRISVRLHSLNLPMVYGTSMSVSCTERRANSTCEAQPTSRLSNDHPRHQSTSKFYCLFEHFRYLPQRIKRKRKKSKSPRLRKGQFN